MKKYLLNFLRISGKFILILVLLMSIFTICMPKGNNRAKIMSDIETHKILPASIFADNEYIFLAFTNGNKEYFLRAPLEDNKKDAMNRYHISLLEQTAAPKKHPVRPVILLTRNFEQLLGAAFAEILPENKGEGTLVMVQHHEVVVLRDEKGYPAAFYLEYVPADTKITARVTDAEFKEILIKEIRRSVKAANLTQTKLLFAIKDQPLQPYLFVDLEKDTSITLQLPEYYNMKRQISELGFSVSILYSFIVKSHLYAVLKTPFTAIHRLLSLVAVSTYTFWSPPIPELKQIPPVNTSGESMNLKNFNEYLTNHVSKRVFKGRAQLLIDGDEFFTHFMLNVLRTTQSIFIRLYIFGADQYSLKIADLLKQKSKDGVDVRIILDELNTILNNTKKPEVKYKPDFVMPSDISKYLVKDSHVKLRTHLNTWGTFDHNKIIILDRSLAYTGGMNFAEQYRYAWHDMMIALRGPVVGRLVKDFYKNWSFNGPAGDFAAAYRSIFSREERDANKEEPGMIDIRILYTAPSNYEIYAAQMEAIKRAKKRIYIQNAYFANQRIVKALIEARSRGVDVRVILPSVNDVTVMHKNNIAVSNILHRNGIKVYFYRGMSHVKASLYDDWALVGSANFDKISLFVNKEMSLGIDDPAFVKNLEERLFNVDFENSDLMTEEKKMDLSFYFIRGVANQL